jgi:type I restriction enzyme S subunit
MGMSKKTKVKKTMDELLVEALVPKEEQPYEIPSNWIWTQLEHLLSRIQYGYTESASLENVGPHFLRITDLKDNGINWSEVPYCKINERDKEKYSLNNNDIVVSRMGSIGKSFLIKEPEDSVFASYLIRLVIKNNLSPDFIALFMKSEIYWSQIRIQSKGTTRPNVNANVFKKMYVPLPPLNEQKRITNKVERLLNKIDQAKQLIEEAKETFELRRAAILDKAFRGELTARWRVENSDELKQLDNEYSDGIYNDDNNLHNVSIPENWSWISTKDLFTFVTSGSRGWAKYYSDIGDLFIRVGNLNYNSIDIDLNSQQKVSPPEGKEGVRTLVKEGDILISITADVGRIAVVPKSFPKAYINQHVALARPNKGFNVEYVAWFLSSKNGGRLQFDRLQRGATKAGLGLNDIKSIWIPIPSLDEQYKIVQDIHEYFNKFNVAEDNLNNTLVLCDTLKQSILSKAFRGELGTNDPTEESAIELLKEVLKEQIS